MSNAESNSKSYLPLNPESQIWDVIVVGTGMGGATLGYALAKGGMKVLFCEKGRMHLGESSAYVGKPVDPSVPYQSHSSEPSVLNLGGRFTTEIEDVSNGGNRSFRPYLGCGSGGSSALYGMVLERFFPSDFSPRSRHPNAENSTLPDRWPVTYAEMVPFYEEAEILYRVRGKPDPDRGGHTNDSRLPPKALTPGNLEMYQFLEAKGFHPYQLSIACEKIPGCEGCEGYLCPDSCKNDSARTCLKPALDVYQAKLLPECEVLYLEASGNEVTGVRCQYQGAPLKLQSRWVVLSGGALMSPSLLLASTSSEWPQGLANRSGWVGRNLMRHLIDLYLVKTLVKDPLRGHLKEIGVNDFYDQADEELGTFQSFNHMPPGPFLISFASQRLRNNGHGWIARLVSGGGPVFARAIDWFLSDKLPFAGILEDLPYRENRVLPPIASTSNHDLRLRLQYNVSEYDRRRIKTFRHKLDQMLKPRSFHMLAGAEDNQTLAHVSGTCRFGDDPGSSVLDPWNKAHELSNLYVVDASFFPSSGGINPSLTIAANALRVARHLLS